MNILQIKLNRLNAQLSITKGRQNQRKLVEKILKIESAINRKVMTSIEIAHIPFDSEDENLLSDSKVIAVQGECFWYDDGFEPRLVPLPTASWAEISVTPEMATLYGDYAGLYLPSGEITTDGSLWATAWEIDLSSLSYSIGFENDEFNQIINDYLDALEASKEASKASKEAWLKEKKRQKSPRNKRKKLRKKSGMITCQSRTG